MRGLLAIIFASLAEAARRFAWRRMWQSERWGGRADWCDRQARNLNRKDRP